MTVLIFKFNGDRTDVAYLQIIYYVCKYATPVFISDKTWKLNVIF
jgi:hypothetical protein